MSKETFSYIFLYFLIFINFRDVVALVLAGKRMVMEMETETVEETEMDEEMEETETVEETVMIRLLKLMSTIMDSQSCQATLEIPLTLVVVPAARTEDRMEDHKEVLEEVETATVMVVMATATRDPTVMDLQTITMEANSEIPTKTKAIVDLITDQVPITTKTNVEVPQVVLTTINHKMVTMVVVLMETTMTSSTLFILLSMIDMVGSMVMMVLNGAQITLDHHPHTRLFPQLISVINSAVTSQVYSDRAKVLDKEMETPTTSPVLPTNNHNDNALLNVVLDRI